MRRASWIALATAAIVALVGAAVRSRVLPTAPLSRPDRRSLTFRQIAGGAAATRSGAWRLTVGPLGLGLIVGAATCGGEVFLLDRTQATIHRVDLRQSAIVGEIGGDQSGADLREPSGLAADCAAERLYVVDGRGVAAIDLASGAMVRRFAPPPRFSNGLGPPVVDAGGDALYAPGVWSAPEPWWRRPAERMFEDDRLGYRLDLRTGAASQLVPAVDRGCWSSGPNCNYAALDRVRAAGGGWIAAHTVSHVVGVFDEERRLVRTIDVRSPLFQEHGEGNRSAAVVDMVAWNEHNSVIRRVFSFGETIATVHSVNRTHGWRPGQQTDFDVFLNVHALDGRGLVCDLRLPDLPVGRDDTSLYIVDYGASGRRRLGTDPVTLIRVPIDDVSAIRAD